MITIDTAFEITFCCYGGLKEVNGKAVHSSGQFAQKVGVDRRTVQRWDSSGVLPAKRTMSGHRYYTDEDVRLVLNQEAVPSRERINIIYARVSSAGQKKDLTHQTEFLRTFCNARGVVISSVLEDVGSGLNYKGKKWNQLLWDVMDRKIDTIYITHKDRFVQFGYDWFSSMCEHFGSKIFVVENEQTSPDKEMIDDIIFIIYVFSCRIHGLRRYKKAIQQDPNLPGSKKTVDKDVDIAV